MLKIIILFLLSVLSYKISQTPNKTTSNDVVTEVVPTVGYFLGPSWFLFAFVTYSYLYYTYDLHEWEYMEIFGCILSATSAIIRLWCYKTLGRLFTFDLAIRSRHKLITTGPYKYIRHPSYTALIFSVVGYSLYIHKVASVVQVLLGISNVLYVSGMAFPTIFISFFILKRIPKEEAMLEKEFKDKWRQYKSKSWRLIPFY